MKKHGDVEVLIAVADTAYFTCTYTEQGRSLYKLIMRVSGSEHSILLTTVLSFRGLANTVSCR